MSMASATRVRLRPRGPFSLEASTRFLEGFAPATAYETRGSAPGDAGAALSLAFPVEGAWSTVGVSVAEEGGTDGGDVVADVTGAADSGAVHQQLARIFSLDVDGTAFPDVGRRDPVVGALQRRFPGLRSVCFWSPYEAAAWAIIGQRTRMSQAAQVKARLAAQLGETLIVGGRSIAAFPSPGRLRELRQFPGITAQKVGRLRDIADAALAGHLDGRRLRELPEDEALERLRELPGIGRFSAALVFVRGAGAPDVFPESEPRFLSAMARAYGLDPGDVPALERIAARWSPYRSWVALLFRASVA